MKKTLLFAAFAAAALVSCSKDQVVDAPKDAIKFSVVTDNATKAADVYCSNNMMPSFTVSAASIDEQDNTAVYILDEEVTNNSGIWSTTIQRYWPESEMLYFVANNIGGIGAGNTGDLQANASDCYNNNDQTEILGTYFEVEDNVADQIDFLYAVSGIQSQPLDNTVSLNFRHALSMIEFQVKNENPTIHIVATGVSVMNVLGYGKFYYPVKSTNYNGLTLGNGNLSHGTSIPPQGIATGSWSFYNLDQMGADWEDECIKTYTATFDGVDATYGEDAASLTLSNDVSGAQRNFTNSMLLIPQSTASLTTTLSPSTKQYLAVKCTIYNVTNPDDGYDADTDKTIIHNGWAVVPFVNSGWEAGYKYIYTFVFGNGDGGIDGGTGDTPNVGDESVLFPINYTVTVDSFLNFDFNNEDVNMDSGN